MLLLGDSDEYNNQSYSKEDLSNYQWSPENIRVMEKRNLAQKLHLYIIIRTRDASSLCWFDLKMITY